MPPMQWLALGYNVPVNPSKNRVYVWRKLKEFGAGYFRPGVAILPKNTQNLQKFRQLSAKIHDMGGEATIAELRFLDAHDEAATVEGFRSQSEREYDELLRDCAKLLENFRKNLFPESDRKDHMRKVMRRYKQVQSRDYFMTESKDRMKGTLGELAEDIGDLF